MHVGTFDAAHIVAAIVLDGRIMATGSRPMSPKVLVPDPRCGDSVTIANLSCHKRTIPRAMV